MKIVIFGLSITSAWGNGHATTFRSLARALHARGHRIIFFEKNSEWYASNRDLPDPSFCTVRIFENWNDVRAQARQELNDCDIAMVGSYFPCSGFALMNSATRDGTLGVEGTKQRDVCARLASMLRPDPARATELERAIKTHGILRPADCWPEFVLQFYRRPHAAKIVFRFRRQARGPPLLFGGSRFLSLVAASQTLWVRSWLYGNLCSGAAAENRGASLSARPDAAR